MSRLGKKPILIPSEVVLNLENNHIQVTGPKGTVSIFVHPKVRVKTVGNSLELNVLNPLVKDERALWGTYASLIKNMLKGVVNGFEKKLEINGIGFKAQLKGGQLELYVGFTHPILYSIPKGINIKVDKNIITVLGIDKVLVGQTAAEIRAIKKPEPYKGKGIKYVNEVIRRKAGKAAKAGAAAAA